MPICLTFDTERNYYELIADRSIPAYKEKKFSMLESAIPKLIEISTEYDVPYTFFLCGEVAENCPHLFTDLGKHSIGVHTHPFTHETIFKGSSPNDREEDRLEKYTFEEQRQMISDDLQLITDSLNLHPKIFRAGKHSANEDTFRALEKIGFDIDCSIHPPFQFVGWQPFKIPDTSIWEIPTYSDVSPEIATQVMKLFRFTSLTKSLFNGIYVGIIHPMTLGNPTIDTTILFDRYREMIEKMIAWDFEFLTIEDAFKQADKKGNLCNPIGRAINMGMAPIHYLIKKHSFKSVSSLKNSKYQ